LSLDILQRLVIDIQKVERNHSIPETDRHENVAEHSFSVAMLCWRIFEAVKPPLDISKILKYALVHDFTERGLTSDVNTYAPTEERTRKKEKELIELEKMSSEFQDFADFVSVLHEYEKLNEEALFVWSIDKMQAIILGEIDNWRPYASYGISYEQFRNKGEEFITKCSPYIRDVFTEVFENASETYYDNPNKKNLHP
jgi:putative hydrolases of HD superfamily